MTGAGRHWRIDRLGGSLATGKLRVHARLTHNPPVVGSSPTRPTYLAWPFLAVLLPGYHIMRPLKSSYMR